MSLNGWALVCPDCSGARTVTSSGAIELPPEEFWDDVFLNLVSCNSCEFRGVIVALESRGHGALGDDTNERTARRLGSGSWESLRSLIEACPSSRSRRCRCPAHRELAGPGKYLEGYETTGTFEVRLAED